MLRFLVEQTSFKKRNLREARGDSRFQIKFNSLSSIKKRGRRITLECADFSPCQKLCLSMKSSFWFRSRPTHAHTHVGSALSTGERRAAVGHRRGVRRGSGDTPAPRGTAPRAGDAALLGGRRLGERLLHAGCDAAHPLRAQKQLRNSQDPPRQGRQSTSTAQPQMQAGTKSQSSTMLYGKLQYEYVREMFGMSLTKCVV